MKNQVFEEEKYIYKVAKDPYFFNLINLRSVIEDACDWYFRDKGAKKVDLFLITNSVSSPIAKGSDSKPIKITINNAPCFLVDSAQFGMEPLVQNHFDLVYCYLPSFRGEQTDARHLSQFYHCEAEMTGSLSNIIDLAEGLVKHLIESAYNAKSEGLFKFSKDSIDKAMAMIEKKFPIVDFDDAFKFLSEKFPQYTKKENFGRIITAKGEKAVARFFGNNRSPVWITRYDRDAVAFYQKPDPLNSEKALNGDLVFPAIENGFGGEIVGAGERQDDRIELLESMKRQGINNSKSYDWYINLRKLPRYRKTSGFGLGIERFVAFLLGKEDIAKSCIYPVKF